MNTTGPGLLDTFDPDTVRRFERTLSDQTAAFQVTRDEVTALKGATAVIQRDMASLASAIDKLVTRFEDSKKTNWPVIAAAFGLVPALLAGFLFVISSQIAGATGPISADIAQIRAEIGSHQTAIQQASSREVTDANGLQNVTQTQATLSTQVASLVADLKEIQNRSISSVQADVSSQTDRKQLNDRVRALEAAVAANQADTKSALANIDSSLVEVEQQFHAVSNIDNLREIWHQRILSLVWDKLHPGEPFPQQTFFPTSIFQASPVGRQK